jgi:hypothetical protein
MYRRPKAYMYMYRGGSHLNMSTSTISCWRTMSLATIAGMGIIYEVHVYMW